jgi:hypothetical protein
MLTPTRHAPVSRVGVLGEDREPVSHRQDDVPPAMPAHGDAFDVELPPNLVVRGAGSDQRLNRLLFGVGANQARTSHG